MVVNSQIEPSAGCSADSVTAALRPLRLGVLGGAFDPPHATHAMLAQLAVEQLQLDKLLIIPTGEAWHKTRALTAAHHRLALCEKAFGGVPRTQIDPREINRKGPTYTVDTLNELRQTETGCELFLIIGGDQARALTTWHEWQRILEYATICVADRAIAERTDAVFDWQSFSQARVVRLAMPLSPISATTIRQQLSLGLDVQKLVGSAVARYIADHRLYTE